MAKSSAGQVRFGKEWSEEQYEKPYALGMKCSLVEVPDPRDPTSEGNDKPWLHIGGYLWQPGDLMIKFSRERRVREAVNLPGTKKRLVIRDGYVPAFPKITAFTHVGDDTSLPSSFARLPEQEFRRQALPRRRGEPPQPPRQLRPTLKATRQVLRFYRRYGPLDMKLWHELGGEPLPWIADRIAEVKFILEVDRLLREYQNPKARADLRERFPLLQGSAPRVLAGNMLLKPEREWGSLATYPDVDSRCRMMARTVVREQVNQQIREVKGIVSIPADRFDVISGKIIARRDQHPFFPGLDFDTLLQAIYVQVFWRITNPNKTIKLCERCGGSFEAKRGNQRYCPFGCAGMARQERLHGKQAAKPTPARPTKRAK